MAKNHLDKRKILSTPQTPRFVNILTDLFGLLCAVSYICANILISAMSEKKKVLQLRTQIGFDVHENREKIRTFFEMANKKKVNNAELEKIITDLATKFLSDLEKQGANFDI